MGKERGVKWTREHRLIALNLYHELPFPKFDQRTPLIIEVAKKMGRTPSSLSMKLCNFASLDPVLKARGIKGLVGASKQDHELWDEFKANSAKLGTESEILLHDLMTTDEDCEVDVLESDKVIVVPTGPTEVLTPVKTRRGQQFFRKTILNAYGIRCCITGINVRRLLVASHIKPWGAFPNERLNPRNGLCLSSLHDAAFDSGLIGVNPRFEVVLSRELKKHFTEPALEQNFAPYEGKSIRMPEKVAEPSAEFLEYHLKNYFKH